MKRFRWAIFGTGFAARKFVLGLRAARDNIPTAVVSRTARNAQRFAEEFGIDSALHCYQQAVERADVDAVYVATPASLHREHALLAISAGKPVLIEKPLATNGRDAGDIATAARRNAVFCMEAMWTRFLPAVDRVKQLINTGAVGRVVMLDASFSFADAVETGSTLYSPDLGGGALLNRGIYPLSLAQYFLGTPDAATANALVGATNVDETVAMILRYRRGTLAILKASTRTASANDCWIFGAEGRIHMHAPIYRPFRITVTRVHERAIRRDIGISFIQRCKEGALLQGAYQRLGHFSLPILNRNSRSFTVAYRGNGYHYEADAVRRAVEAGELESAIMPLAESVQMIELMDRLRDSW